MNLVRFDWLVENQRRVVNPTTVQTDLVFLYSIPALDELGDGRYELIADVGSGKLLLTGGEVLISKLNPRLPRVVVAQSHDVPTLASSEFIALRPGPGVDRRFLIYWLTSGPVRQRLEAATMSATRSQQRIRPDILTKSWVWIPPLHEQRGMADFLDAETGRIDALIAKKSRLVLALDEREQAAILEISGDWRKAETASLRQLGPPF